jgi:hypothetical protein
VIVVGIGGGVGSKDGHGYLWRAHPAMPIIESEGHEMALRVTNYPTRRHSKERNKLIGIFVEEKQSRKLILAFEVQLFSLETFPYLIRKESL